MNIWNLSTEYLARNAILAGLLMIGCSPQHSKPGSHMHTLPNQDFTVLDSPSELYMNLIAFFGASELDFDPDPSQLSLTWPLATEHVDLLTRFGTPTLLATVDESNFQAAYFHEALDIRRPNAIDSDEVNAPVSGLATVIYDGDPSGNEVSDYSVGIAIYDPKSHLVINLLHVLPIDSVKAGELKSVKQGDLIGHLTPVESMKPEFEINYRHTHLAVVDVHNKKLVNPLTHFAQYKDSVPPTAKDVYLLDETGRRMDSLHSGSLDLVANVFDRDDSSQRNFEIGYLAFKVTDDQGLELKSLESCGLNSLTENSLDSASSKNINSFLDLSGAIEQASEVEWIDLKTDAANPNRSFRYALTNIKSNQGACSVMPDQDGILSIADNVKYIDVFIAIRDQHGNTTTTTKRFER